MADADLEIFNPDLHIATLEDNASLIMELDLVKGREISEEDLHTFDKRFSGKIKKFYR